MIDRRVTSRANARRDNRESPLLWRHNSEDYAPYSKEDAGLLSAFISGRLGRNTSTFVAPLMTLN
jgi:hypothetical protein